MMNAWMRLGIDVRGTPNAWSAIRDAHLADWNVEAETLYSENEVLVPGVFALTKRSGLSSSQFLSVVGSRHKIVQNEELEPLLDGLAYGHHFYAAGSFDSKVFVTIRRSEGGFVSVLNGHDAKTPLSVIYTPEVDGTLLAVQSLKTDLSPASITAAKWWANTQVLNTGIQRDILRGAKLTRSAFETRVVKLLGPPAGASEATVSRAWNKLNKVSHLFGDGTNAWDGMVALCTWYDHFSPVRGDDSVRARKAVLEPEFKRKALDLMLTA